MKLSDEMKVVKEDLEQNESELNKEFLKYLYRFIPQVEALEKENARLELENKKWNKEFDKYDF